MKVEIEVPDYSSEFGLKAKWESGFEIECKFQGDRVLIQANREGLLSLANHLINLAQDTVPQGRHFHFDESNSLEDGSVELIIEKR